MHGTHSTAAYLRQGDNPQIMDEAVAFDGNVGGRPTRRRAGAAQGRKRAEPGVYHRGGRSRRISRRRTFGGDSRSGGLDAFGQAQQQKSARDEEGDDCDQDRQQVRRQRRRLHRPGARIEREPRHRGAVHAGDGETEHDRGQRQRMRAAAEGEPQRQTEAAIATAALATTKGAELTISAQARSVSMPI